MDPQTKEALARKRQQRLNGDPGEEGDQEEEEGDDLLTIDEIQIQRDENNEVLPIKVPYLSDLSMSGGEPDKKIVIKPFDATQGREYQLRMYEAQEKMKTGEWERKSGYLFDESGNLQAYHMPGAQGEDDWCIPVDLLMDYLNDHLVEPSFEQKFTRFEQVESVLGEEQMGSLFITIKVYGSGVPPGASDNVEVVRDKKK